MSQDHTIGFLNLAAELTIAWLGNSNNRVAADDVPEFLGTMFRTVSALVETTNERAVTILDAESADPFTPAVSARKSLASKDHIISMIDGKPYKTLRRHLTRHGLTPDEYRARYGLKHDYPMVAESYSEARRDMAKRVGLGRTPRTADGPAEPLPEIARRRSRKKADA